MFAQCTAVPITSKKAQYCISEYVELNAANIPTGSIIEWNLGNSWDTSTANFSGSALNSGNLSASLRVTLTGGQVCNYLAFNVAHINDLPEIKYDVSRNLLCNGVDTITFWDKTAKSTNRTWIIGNTTYSNTTKVSTIKTPNAGNLSLTLIVDDSNGCRNVATFNNVLKVYENINLDITKSSNRNCYPVSTDLLANFTLGTQSIKTYDWEIPGAYTTSANSKDVKNALFANVGNFSPTLKIETNQGCSYSITKKSFITVGDSVDLALSSNKSQACLS